VEASGQEGEGRRACIDCAAVRGVYWCLMLFRPLLCALCAPADSAHCAALHCTALHCTALHCTVLATSSALDGRAHGDKQERRTHTVHPFATVSGGERCRTPTEWSGAVSNSHSSSSAA
jgi:hypothetical protein